MIAYVRDEELFVASLKCGEPKQITFGARESGKVSLYINNIRDLSQSFLKKWKYCLLHLIEFTTVCADSWATGVHCSGNDIDPNLSMLLKLSNFHRA
jgi:hypothetical protein